MLPHKSSHITSPAGTLSYRSPESGMMRFHCPLATLHLPPKQRQMTLPRRSAKSCFIDLRAALSPAGSPAPTKAYLQPLWTSFLDTGTMNKISETVHSPIHELSLLQWSRDWYVECPIRSTQSAERTRSKWIIKFSSPFCAKLLIYSQ